MSVFKGWFESRVKAEKTKQVFVISIILYC